MRWMATTGMALMLAACGGAPPERATGGNAMTPAADGTNYQAAVLKLEPRQRDGVFLRAILDAEQPCQGVNDVARQPDDAGAIRWAVRCEGGADWLVAILPSGDARVTGPIGNAVFGKQ